MQSSNHYGLITFGVLVTVMFCLLGLWQTQRAAQKQQRFDAYKERRAAPPIDAGMWIDASAETLYWRRLSARGHFLAESYLLDNRIRRGQVGYEVVAPFQLDAGSIVFVNRGWIAGPPRREIVPAIIVPESALSIHGHAGPPPVTGLSISGADDQLEHFAPPVYRLQRVSLATLTARYQTPSLPVMLYLDAQSPAAFDCRWPSPGSGAARHRAYALQWFVMAIVLLGLIIYLQRRHRQRES